MSLGKRCQKNYMYPVTNPLGTCLIINIKHYEPQTGRSERQGSEVDVQRIQRLFGEVLNFTVITREDLTGSEIQECLESVAANFDGAMQSQSCFFCFLMGHGTNKRIVGRDGVEQPITDLIALMYSDACPAMADKPKIFIVQASRPPSAPYEAALLRSARRQAGEAVPSDDEVEAGDEDDDDISFNSRFLRDPDILACFANTAGAPVVEDPATGSVYLTAVCELIEDGYKFDHLDDILTEVNDAMSSRPVTWNGRQYYSVPERMSSLTHKCFLDVELAET